MAGFLGLDDFRKRQLIEQIQRRRMEPYSQGAGGLMPGTIAQIKQAEQEYVPSTDASLIPNNRYESFYKANPELAPEDVQARFALEQRAPELYGASVGVPSDPFTSGIMPPPQVPDLSMQRQPTTAPTTPQPSQGERVQAAIQKRYANKAPGGGDALAAAERSANLQRLISGIGQAGATANAAISGAGAPAQFYKQQESAAQQPLDFYKAGQVADIGRQALDIKRQAAASKSPTALGAKKLADERAKIIAEWQDKGMSNHQEKIRALREAIQNLGQTDMASGSIVGQLSDEKRVLLPGGQTGRRAKNLMESTVLETLRATLGAQFTEREGSRILGYTFDPLADESTNIQNAKNLMLKLEKIARAKQNLVDYANAHGGDTSGYTGPTYASDEEIMSEIAPELLGNSIGSGGGLSSNDKRALNWLKNNPDDPRAEQVKTLLQQKLGT